MSKKKSKLFMSLVALVFCLGIMCFGVYAATSVSYTLSGHITYDVSDVFVDIETRHYLSTQTDLTSAKGEVASVMGNIATSLESGTTSIDGVTELASDYDKQSTLNNVGGEELPLTGSELNIRYGAYSNTSGEEKAYVHYIAILVTNYAEEEINAILDLDSLYDLTGSNSVIFPYRTMENIPAKSGETNGVMSYVFALGLDNPAQSADVDFTGVELSVTRGNLDQYATEGLKFEYSSTDEGYLVSDYTGTDTRVIVPSTYDDGTNGPHPVVGIKEGTYSGSSGAKPVFTNKSFKEIYLPNTLKSIGDYSFSECSSLVNVKMPDSMDSIGSSAFGSCTSLTSITIPDGVSTISGASFLGLTSLTSVTIPNSVQSIDNQAFQSCKSLTSVIIPNSVKGIGFMAFCQCSNLTEITLSDKFTSIDNSVFDGTPWLDKLQSESNGIATASDGVTRYAISVPTTITDSELDLRNVKVIAGAAYSGCTSLISITIPNSVISIGVSAFAGCKSLSEITIPDSVESIGSYAFSGCTNLTSVDFEDKITYWTVGSTQLTSTELSNLSTMATYLTSTYIYYTWTKNV